MGRNLWLAASISLAVLAAGCHKPESDIVGKWKVDGEQMSTRVALEFKPDKTFTGPRMEGTYKVVGQTVTLQVRQFLGRDVSKVSGNNGEAMILSQDGKSLTFARGAQPMKFVKVTGS